MGVLLLAMALAAPVPKESHRPPELTHGVWTIQWNNSPYTATLSSNGEFSEFLTAEGALWVGTWTWDAEKRRFSVAETVGGQWFYRWTVTLDGNLAGTTCGGVKLRMMPFRTPKQMPEK